MNEKRIAKDRFRPWYWEAELKEMDAASAQGWQLTARTKKTIEYEYAPAVRYRYAMDYRFGHREEQYLPLFTDAGWEPVSWLGNKEDSFEGRWYFFHKVYDPELPEEEYQIATDAESQKAMRERFVTGIRTAQGGAHLLYRFLVILPATMALALFSGITLEVIAMVLFACGALVLEWYRKQCILRLHPEKPGKSAHCCQIVLGLVIPALIVTSAAFSLRAETLTFFPAPAAGCAFRVYVPNLYTVKMGANTETDNTFTLYSEDGTVLRSASGTGTVLQDTLFLTPGTYTMERSASDMNYRSVTFGLEAGWCRSPGPR